MYHNPKSQDSKLQQCQEDHWIIRDQRVSPEKEISSGELGENPREYRTNDQANGTGVNKKIVDLIEYWPKDVKIYLHLLAGSKKIKTFSKKDPNDPKYTRLIKLAKEKPMAEEYVQILEENNQQITDDEEWFPFNKKLNHTNQ